jgi:flagellar biosynthesis/type III secretory pathway ATPase
MEKQNQTKQGKNTLRKTGSIAKSSEPKCSLDKSDCTQKQKAIKEYLKQVQETDVLNLTGAYNKGRKETLDDVMKIIGWLQSETLIDSPNYFTVSIDNWEGLKQRLKSLEQKA